MSYNGAYKVFNNESSSSNGAPNSSAQDKDKIIFSTINSYLQPINQLFKQSNRLFSA